MAYYVVRINNQTHVMDSQFVMPISDEVAEELKVMLARVEEACTESVLHYMGG
jgi:hypothetical protein